MASRTPPRTSLTTRTTCRDLRLAAARARCSRSATSASPARSPSPAGDQPVERAIPLELVRCDMTARPGRLRAHPDPPHRARARSSTTSYWYRSGVNRTMTENLHGIAHERRGARRPARPATSSSTSAATTARCSTATGPTACATSASTPPTSRATRSRRATTWCATSTPTSGCSSRYPDRKAQGRSRASRCSTTSRTRARSSRTWPQPRRGRRLGDGAALPAVDARAQRVRRDRARAPRVLLAGRDRAADRRRPGLETVAASSTTSTAARSGCSSRHAGRIATSTRTTARAPGPAHPGVRAGARLARALRALPRRARSASATSCTTLCQRAARRRARRSTSTAPRPRATRSSSTRTSTPSVIPYAADRNPDKWGSRRSRTDIPIISEEESRAMKPDYYLVLPWHFLDEFLERERELPRRRRPLHRARCPRSASCPE